MKPGDVIEMSNGWMIEVDRVEPWPDSDNGDVYGRMGWLGEWTDVKYVGTIKGINQCRVSAA